MNISNITARCMNKKTQLRLWNWNKKNEKKIMTLAGNENNVNKKVEEGKMS